MSDQKTTYFLKEFFLNFKVSSSPKIELIAFEKYIKRIGVASSNALKYKDKDEIYKRFNKEIKENNENMEKISKETFKKLDWILFHKSQGHGFETLYSSKFFEPFVKSLIQKKYGVKLKRLIKEILIEKQEIDEYDQKNIDYIKNILESKFSQKLSISKFLKSNKKFSYLERGGLKRLSQTVLKQERGIQEIHETEEYWPMKNPRFITGGLGYRFIDSLSENTKEPESILKVMDYIEFLREKIEGFSLINEKVIDRFFNPFKEKYSEKFSNTQMLQKRLEKLSEECLDDPRVNISRWFSIPESKEIMIKWKIEKSVNNFFSLLDYVSKNNSQARRMWPERKKFIKTCLRNGYITDAWFVLGNKAYNDRNKFLIDSKITDFGRLSKGDGNQLEHSVFLFRIKGKSKSVILSEWSHNGKVRVWRGDAEIAPEFYKKEYKRKELIFKQEKYFENGELEAIYHHVNWRKKLEECIRTYTGVDINKKKVNF